MARRTVEILFRDTHEDLTEWICEYCKQVATTIRHGVAVCAQHKDLLSVGVQPSPPVPPEAPANH